MTTDDRRVAHPVHYNSHPSGIECIQLAERLPFDTGNAVKYVWRAGQKHDGACPMFVATVLDYALDPPRFEVLGKRAAAHGLPCEHCRQLDLRKAAYYLRCEARRLASDDDRYTYQMALHNARPILRVVWDAIRTQDTDPLVLVIDTLLGRTTDHREPLLRLSQRLETEFAP